MFIVGDRMINKVDGCLLRSFLKHQYLVKTNIFSIPKTIDVYYYIKLIQREFNPEIFVLHVGTNDLLLNKQLKQISEDGVTLAERWK